MTRLLSVIFVLVMAMPAPPAAHQLDEYLQAARLALERDRVVLEIDLTPGVDVAAEIVAALDLDGNGVISPLEARAYGETMIGDLEVSVDGRPVRLSLSAIEIPPVDDMRHGIGTMKVTAAGAVANTGSRARQVHFRNRHRPAGSVYLANALVPGDPDLKVIAQVRDRRQQRLDVEYQIASRWPLQMIWVLFGATVIASRIALNK
jgi:hypothetical protein